MYGLNRNRLYDGWSEDPLHSVKIFLILFLRVNSNPKHCFLSAAPWPCMVPLSYQGRKFSHPVTGMFICLCWPNCGEVFNSQNFWGHHECSWALSKNGLLVRSPSGQRDFIFTGGITWSNDSVPLWRYKVILKSASKNPVWIQVAPSICHLCVLLHRRYLSIAT